MHTMLELSTKEGQFKVLYILCFVLLSDWKYRFNQLYHMTPLMEKLDACKNMSRKQRVIWIYMESLAFKNGAPPVYWKENSNSISIVEAKIFPTRFKKIGTTVCFLQERFYNGLFLPKYEKSSVMTADMCTRPWSGQIISHGPKCMTGFRFYPTSDTEHYVFMKLQKIIVN